MSLLRSLVCPALRRSAAAVAVRRLTHHLDGKKGETATARKERQDELWRPLESIASRACSGGSQQTVELHMKRGRLLLRDRLQRLCDPGTESLVFGELAGHKMYNDDIPGGGIFTGICQISGILCVVVANDPTVKGGTYYPITGKKHLRAQEIAEQNRLPCVYLVDSGGGFLPLQSEGFADRDMFGRIFYNQATMSSKGIFQISAVLGPCTAGGAYIPCMSDESIILAKHGHIFLGGPHLVKAATGEIVTTEQLGGALLHCKMSGVSDYYSETEDAALRLCRELVQNLREEVEDDLATAKDVAQPARLQFHPEAPDAEMTSIVPTNDFDAVDAHELIRRLADNGRFTEFKALFGTSLVCAAARIHGRRVGFVVNNGSLTGEGATKAAHFIQVCDQKAVPVIFLHNLPADKQDSDADFKRIGHLIAAVATFSAPKISLYVSGSYGSAHFAMAGRAFSPNFVAAWPRARLGLDPTNPDAPPSISSLDAGKNLFVDMVIHPAHTRKTLSNFLAACFSGVPVAKTARKNTLFRM